MLVSIDILGDSDGDDEQIIKTQFNDSFVGFVIGNLLVLQHVLYGCVTITFKFALISIEPKSTQKLFFFV